MKSALKNSHSGLCGSLPVRGAWIEINAFTIAVYSAGRSLPVRGAWIEICRVLLSGGVEESLPVRGAWIEITICARRKARKSVAPRAGSVD